MECSGEGNTQEFTVIQVLDNAVGEMYVFWRWVLLEFSEIGSMFSDISSCRAGSELN